jgi:hypothetical protein
VCGDEVGVLIVDQGKFQKLPRKQTKNIINNTFGFKAYNIKIKLE